MTGKIEIISASAGSGKTHTLSERLNKEVSGGKVRPDAVVATTFTNRAAAELQERVRTSLLRANRIDDAQVLSTARIGTVNSVCGRLVSSFAFQLGLPVSLRILDENQAGLVLQRTLSRVVTLEEAEELAELKSRWRDLDWEADVGRIVDLARSNGIKAEELEECAARSVKEYEALLGGSPIDADKLTSRVVKSIEALAAEADRLDKPPGVTKKAVARAMAFVSRVRGGGESAWSEWLWLCKIDAGAKVKDAAGKVRQAALLHDRHPQMGKDLKRIVELVFSIAARGLSAYQEYKRELGLCDFVDQEVLALQLLESKEVRERLKDEIDLVLVDEFQDTSPLQLAVFLALSGLSDNSVWVGDQKQAIYGFRGTDPRLMDDAIEAILKTKKPQTLKNSHRSRPELVRLTSDIFQDSFKSQKIPKERVRLEPVEDSEPDGLGPIVERWVLAARNKSEQAAAVAAGVRELLDDPDTLVRVKGRDEARNIKPCDIAVLCRTNDECKDVADSLEKIGVKAAIARPGLLGRPEARLVLCGLRLWFDPEDRLAAAELLRLCCFADSPEAWLKKIIEPGALEDESIKAARQDNKFADLLQVFDRVAAAVDARGFCLSWGDSEKRLYNLDALRELVAAYTKSVSEGGAGGTLGGLLAHLERVGEEGLDEQATVADESAVVVSTWHGAKGLEWPYVVIHSLDAQPKGSALGVKVVSQVEKFDLKNPLLGRWIRYWPYPYIGLGTKSALKDRLLDHPADSAAREEEARERLRLLYVCWTRARDRLLLPALDGRLSEGVLSLLDPPIDDILEKFPVRNLAPIDEKERRVEPGEGYVLKSPQKHEPAWKNPSDMESEGKPGEPEKIGAGCDKKGEPNPGHLGDAIHGFFAADQDGLEDSVRRSIAAGLLERFEVADALDPDDLVKAGDAFKKWVNHKWPGAKWHREMPMMYRLDSGSIVRGFCDLALETEGGWVVIDHKSKQKADEAAQHAGQLDAYAKGIEKATGKHVLSCWIHLPLAGLVVSVRPPGRGAD